METTFVDLCCLESRIKYNMGWFVVNKICGWIVFLSLIGMILDSTLKNMFNKYKIKNWFLILYPVNQSWEVVNSFF